MQDIDTIGDPRGERPSRNGRRLHTQPVIPYACHAIRWIHSIGRLNTNKYGHPNTLAALFGRRRAQGKHQCTTRGIMACRYAPEGMGRIEKRSDNGRQTAA